MEFLNNNIDIVSDMIEGYFRIYNSEYDLIYDKHNIANGIVKKHINNNNVRILVGSGAGNEPWCLGYVGEGLADGAVIGRLYTAPPAKSILDLAYSMPNENGIIFLCTNHSGDVLNFELARELAELAGIRVINIVVADDVSADFKDNVSDRAGSAGIALVLKILGGAANMSCSFDTLSEIGNYLVNNTYTLGATVIGDYNYLNSKKHRMVEYGRGFNGENGFCSDIIDDFSEIAYNIAEKLIYVSKVTENDDLIVMINGYLNTSYMDLYRVSKNILEILNSKKINVHDIFVDRVFEVKDAMGCTVTILKLREDIVKYYDSYAYSPLLKHWLKK